MKLWQKEHGNGYDIPSTVEYLVSRKVLQDISWHNDSSPSFAILDPDDEDYGIRLWIDHPIKSRREREDPRFGVQLGELASQSDEEISTDDLEEALNKVFEYAKNPRFEDTQIRKQRWWDASLSASELMGAFLEDLSSRR